MTVEHDGPSDLAPVTVDGFLAAVDEELDELALDDLDGVVRIRCRWCGARSIRGTVCALALPCGDCGARAGRPCRRPSGHRTGRTHAVRWLVAEELERRAGVDYPGQLPRETDRKMLARITRAIADLGDTLTVETVGGDDLTIDLTPSVLARPRRSGNG